MSSPQQIRVLARHGDIKVKASQDGKAHVLVEKNLRSESQSGANRQNESSHPKFEQQGKIWVLDLTGNNFARGRFNLDLELPPGADLSATTHYGNVSVEDRPGNVDLSTDHGDLTAEQVKGNVTVNARRGSVPTKDLNGTAALNARGDIIASHFGRTRATTPTPP